MPCKVCQSSDIKVIRTKLRYDIPRDVLQCLNCGFVYLAAKKASDEAFYSGKEYRQHYGPDLTRVVNCQEVFDTYFPAQAPIIKEIEHILKPDMKVLDIGCSTGHFLTALKSKVGERVGLELSQAEVEFIQKNLDFKVYNVPIGQAEIAEGPFDLITAFQVLEHIENPLSFLQAINRNLKPGGQVYFELPNLNDVLVGTYQVEGYINFFFHEPHVSYFSEKTLKDLMAQAGFDGEVKTVQRYSILNHLNWILTGQPQKNFSLGNSQPELVKTDTVPEAVKQDLNNFIQQADQEYKKIINKHKLGESLTFLGTKTK